MHSALFPHPLPDAQLRALYTATRSRTRALVAGLHAEDMTVQSMEDASPTKWHLAHTTWFFEEFVLRAHLPGYQTPDARFDWLFNSYYVQVGPRYERARRGLVTRPTVADILTYRDAIDERMEAGLAAGDLPLDLVELGCHHEMQHQELILTDLLHALSFNPLCPAYRAPAPLPVVTAAPLAWHALEGGVVEIGHGDGSFAYDCEGPRHEALIRPFELASRLVTCGDWLAFMADGGYETATLWLSDGWATREREGWTAPGYWFEEGGDWRAFGLRGAQPIDPDAPVSHVSFFEADAFARWAGARLPTEFEREAASSASRRLDGIPRGPDGALLEAERLRPAAAGGPGLAQLDGDVWEWTASPFVAYPGFAPPSGAVGEYNGKFMNGQYVLRGGSALTPTAQLRDSYRNFFPPDARWQMSGLRLARDPAIDAHGRPGKIAPSAAAPGAHVHVPKAEGVTDAIEGPIGAAPDPTRPAFSHAMRGALRSRPRRFDPKWFYDAAGSALFDRLCATDAYYVTRTELGILETYGAEMAACIGPNAVLFEPGAGSLRKARPLLAALRDAQAFVPADIDPAHLAQSVAALASERPHLRIEPLTLDLTGSLELPVEIATLGPVTAFFPGSTIGNFTPDAARALLRRFRVQAGATGLLIGFDLPPGGSKTEARLVEAYDDPDGITACFNRNLLLRANRELGAGFDVSDFRHVARYDALLDRIEMHLVAGHRQAVTIDGETFRIEAGESMLTELSWKYSVDAFDGLASDAGWVREGLWTDEAAWFAVAFYRLAD